jgi:ubiquinone/menaquinone biosynthesis C-methylase UbiE
MLPAGFPIHQFDIVYCISVLEHLRHVDQDLSLKEFARVIKPGGRVALTFDYPTVDLQQLYRAAESRTGQLVS